MILLLVWNWLWGGGINRGDMWYRAQEKDSLGPGAGFQVRCKWIVKLALMAKLRTHDR